MDTFLPVQAPKLYLAGSGVTSTATSAQVKTLYKPGTTTKIQMTDFGSVGYGVFEPGTEREENFSFTGITYSGEMATFTGVTRGLDFVSPYAETAALKHAHAGGTVVYISNTAPFYAELGAKDNDESVTGVWTFSASNIPRLGSAGTWGAGTEEYLVTKRYADALTVSGAPDGTTTQKGVYELATQAQSDAGTSAGDSTTASLVATPDLTAKSVQKGAWTYAADAGADDTYAITLAVAPTAYAAGLELTFDPNTSNTGAATLNVNSLGAKDIKKYCNGAIAALENNDIVAGMPCRVSYDGTQFVLLSPMATQLDSATSYEAQQFFAATDITGAEAETLTSGTASDASAKHYHDEYENAKSMATAGKYIMVGGLGDGLTTITQGTGNVYRTTGNTVLFSTAAGDDAGLRAEQSLYMEAAEPSDLDLEWADSYTASAFIKVKFSGSVTQDFFFGFYDSALLAAPANATDTTRHVAWMVDDGTLYYSVADGTTQNRNSTACTLTNDNIMEIVFTSGANAVFKLNGSTVATVSTNIPGGTSTAGPRFTVVYTGQSASDQVAVIAHPFAVKIV